MITQTTPLEKKKTIPSLIGEGMDFEEDRGALSEGTDPRTSKAPEMSKAMGVAIVASMPILIAAVFTAVLMYFS